MKPSDTALRCPRLLPTACCLCGRLRANVDPNALGLRLEARLDEGHRVRTLLDAGIRILDDGFPERARHPLLRDLGVDVAERFAQALRVSARRMPQREVLGRQKRISASDRAHGLALE